MHLSVPLATLGETLVSALAGLLGVIVGALLAEWREWYKRHTETVSAARLVDAELADTLAKIEGAVAPQAGSTNKALAVQLETPAWLEARAALAGGLTPEQWGDVRDAFASVSALRVAIDADGGASGVEEQGRTAMNRIRAARETLAGF